MQSPKESQWYLKAKGTLEKNTQQITCQSLLWHFHHKLKSSPYLTQELPKPKVGEPLYYYLQSDAGKKAYQNMQEERDVLKHQWNAIYRKCGPF